MQRSLIIHIFFLSVIVSGCIGYPQSDQGHATLTTYGNIENAENDSFRYDGGIYYTRERCQEITYQGVRLLFADENREVFESVSIGTVDRLGYYNVSTHLDQRPMYTFVRASAATGDEACTLEGYGLKWGNKSETFRIGPDTLIQS